MAAPMKSQIFNFAGNYSTKSVIFSNIFTITLLVFVTIVPKLVYGSSFLYQDVLLSIKLYCFTIAICQFGLIFLNFRASPRVFSIKFKPLLKSLIIILIGAAAFHVISILFGASLIESFTETFHFSCLLSLLTALPCCCVLGCNLDNWQRLFGLNSAESMLESQVFITTLSSIVGAWLGAIPIPLDWDRWWQKWPTTCVCGALLGYENGLVISSLAILYHSWKQKKSKLV